MTSDSHPAHRLCLSQLIQQRIFSKDLLDSSPLAAKRVASALALLFYLFIFFFISWWTGETSLRWHPPSCGNGFPGPLLCQLLAAVVLQSKRCRNPFSGQCLWLRMLPPPPLCVCVLLRRRDRVGMRGNELDSNAYDEYLFYLFRKRMHALLLALIRILSTAVDWKILISTTAGTMPKPFSNCCTVWEDLKTKKKKSPAGNKAEMWWLTKKQEIVASICLSVWNQPQFIPSFVFYSFQSSERVNLMVVY